MREVVRVADDDAVGDNDRIGDRLDVTDLVMARVSEMVRRVACWLIERVTVMDPVFERDR